MYLRRSFRLGLLPLFLFLLGSTFQLPNLSAQGLLLLDSIVQAHGLDPVPPISVLITGFVERNGKTEPFRMIATRDEELRIEYGSQGKDTLVSTSKVTFRTDGEKITFPQGTSRFNQLDVTGLFLVQQLRNRAVQVEATGERKAIQNTAVQRISVQSERTKGIAGMPRINDRVDLYVTEQAGLLAGLSRSFFEGRPEAYTETIIFSNYRPTGEQMLPYRIDVYLKASLRQSFQIQSYEFNVPADRDLFLPKRTR